MKASTTIKLSLRLSLAMLMSTSVCYHAYAGWFSNENESKDKLEAVQEETTKQNVETTGKSTESEADVEEPTHPAVVTTSDEKLEDLDPNDPKAFWQNREFQKRFMGSYGFKADIEPEISVEEREQLKAVLGYMSNDQTEEAMAQLKTAITSNSSAIFEYLLANVYFQNNELTEAAKWYEQAVAKLPSFRRAQKNLGLVHLRNGNFKKSIKALSKAVELGENTSLTYGLLGYAYTSNGNHLAAESAYRQALLLKPEAKDWKMGLSRSLFQQKKYAAAATLCNELIAKDTTNPDYWRLQANAFLGFQKPLEAAQNYEFLKMLGEANEQDLNTLGDIYLKNNMMRIAASTYIAALEKNPKQDAESLIQKAKILARSGSLNGAENLLNKIRKTYKDTLSVRKTAQLLRLEARIAMQKGAEDKHARLLERVVHRNPLDGEALILLGQHYKRKGDIEKATFYYERAENIKAVEAKAKIRHAQLLVEQSKFQEAVPLLEAALQVKHREDVSDYLEQVKALAKTR